VGQEPRTGETRVVEVVSSLSYFLMNLKVFVERVAARGVRLSHELPASLPVLI
jgi:hypothetical protein